MTRIPEHIAIIMDGNGRWATERNKPRSYGHQAGVDTVRRITSECVRLGVKYLTLYTFSTENWSRPSDEIAALMGLVLTSLEDEIFMKNNVRFRVIGDIARLPQEVQNKLHETEEHTAKNSAMTMVVALSYSARWEITKAMREIIAEHQLDSSSFIQPEMITEDVISRHLQTNFMPDPDLLIRTGGSCVSPIICYGRLLTLNFTSVILIGQTLMSWICIKLLEVFSSGNAVSERLRNKLKMKINKLHDR